jgi:hypothetical protein
MRVLSRSSWLVGACALAGLTGCAGGVLEAPAQAPIPAPAAPDAIAADSTDTAADVDVALPIAAAGGSVDRFVGRWGLASYHRDADRARAERDAHAQCGTPYVIANGPNGALTIHRADQGAAQELVLKRTEGGHTFIGPASEPAGGADDREVILASPNSFTVTWVKPDAAARSGTMVYVRCGTSAAG